MNFFQLHIFREDNQCADSFANKGLNLDQLTYWFSIPGFIFEHFIRNKLDIPSLEKKKS